MEGFIDNFKESCAKAKKEFQKRWDEAEKDLMVKDQEIFQFFIKHKAIFEEIGRLKKARKEAFEKLEILEEQKKCCFHIFG